jgi:hypothetical protein
MKSLKSSLRIAAWVSELAEVQLSELLEIRAIVKVSQKACGPTGPHAVVWVFWVIWKFAREKVGRRQVANRVNRDLEYILAAREDVWKLKVLEKRQLLIFC